MVKSGGTGNLLDVLMQYIKSILDSLPLPGPASFADNSRKFHFARKKSALTTKPAFEWGNQHLSI
jgi:hypothetical protein